MELVQDLNLASLNLLGLTTPSFWLKTKKLSDESLWKKVVEKIIESTINDHSEKQSLFGKGSTAQK